MTPLPFVSVVIPCRNEERFIGACLDSVEAQDYDRDRMEVLVVDGASDDRTRDIVDDYAPRSPHIRRLDNPRRIIPAALNLGIRAARGEVIVRMDAHNSYPTDYVSSLVSWLRQSGADNVGGIWITRPANASPMARAIALGLSHPFGVGNSYFRIGTPEPRWVDNVPLGCYRRDVFDRIGLYDEELVRNEDDELNLRLLKNGGRILLVPSNVSYYHARESLAKMSRMLFQYGYFKPLVVRKIGSIMTVRQIVPAAFVLGLASTALLAPWFAPMAALCALIAGTYLTASAIAAGSAVRRHGLRCAGAMIIVFAAMHVSYGLGYLKGALDFLGRRRASVANPAAYPLTR